jgi:hypothetical protein
MAAKILPLFALLALSVSAATALSFPQYNPSSITLEVNNLTAHTTYLSKILLQASHNH